MANSRSLAQQRTGGVLIVVLVVMAAVAFLTAQGVRLSMLTNQAHQQRMKSAQIKEIVELARMRLDNERKAETFVVSVPGYTAGTERTANVSIDPKPKPADGWIITVRFPYNEASETIVTWESPL